MRILITLFCVMLLSATAWAEDYTMTWTKDPVEDDLAGFKVYSTADLQAGFALLDTINDKDTREYTHAGVDGARWWYLTAFDTSGNESIPSNIVDNVAPGPVIVVRKVVSE